MPDTGQPEQVSKAVVSTGPKGSGSAMISIIVYRQLQPSQRGQAGEDHDHLLDGLSVGHR